MVQANRITSLHTISKDMAIQFGHWSCGTGSTIQLTSSETCIGLGGGHHTIRTGQYAEAECILNDDGEIVAIGYICKKHEDSRSYRDFYRSARRRRGEEQSWQMGSKLEEAHNKIREARRLLYDAQQMATNKYVKYDLKNIPSAKHTYDVVQATVNEINQVCLDYHLT